MSTKKFNTINFGCRVNSAEINQLAQNLVDRGFQHDEVNPDVIIVNTCAITKKGEKESINTIIALSKKYPHSKIQVTGCATDKKISHLKNVEFFDNREKHQKLTNSSYTPDIKDKFSHTHRYLLRIQAGCTQFCSFCIVPFRRPELWSLPIDQATTIVKEAIDNQYTEIIITGVNLEQYQPGFSDLLENLLTKTNIPLISYGSVPVNCIDDKFITLLNQYPDRLSRHLHIPLQSGSDKILSLMNRPYTRTKIDQMYQKLQKVNPKLTFGADIIVGFPNETEDDFQQTLDLCQSIGFTNLHTFTYSPRIGTKGRIIFENSPKINNLVKKQRSQLIRKSVINVQTRPPSHQTPET